MAGLQGSGKTTTSAKLARWFRQQGRNPMLVGADLQRPAAVEQLRTLGVADRRAGVLRADRSGRGGALRRSPRLVGSVGTSSSVDTAGRLAIDEEMMEEVRQISEVLDPDYTFLVVDAMTGQDAVERRRGVPPDPRARRRHPHQARRRRPRRRGVVGQGGGGSPDRLRVDRGEARGLRAVPPRPPRRAHPRHGRRAHAHREGRGGLRDGPGRGGRPTSPRGHVHLRRLPRPDAGHQEDGPALERDRDDAGNAQGGPRRRDRRQGDRQGRGDHPIDDGGRADRPRQ